MKVLIASFSPEPVFRASAVVWRSRLRGRSKFDQRWECTDTSSPTRNGRGLSHSFLPGVVDVRLKASVGSSALCIGSPERVAPGATCRGGTASGSPCTTDSTTGRSAASGNGSSRKCRSIRIRQSLDLKPRSSMAPPSGRTSTPRAEKGDPTQCSGTLSRRFFDEDSCPRRHSSSTPTHRAHPGAAARADESRRPSAPCRWIRLHCRHGLRRGLVSRPAQALRLEASHRVEAGEGPSAAQGPGALRSSLPGREILPWTQTLPPPGDSL